MSTTLTLLAALALLAPGASRPPAVASAICASLEDYAELAEAYALAEEAYRERVSQAEPADRRELRKAHPAIEFWPRFQAAAEAGEGRALLWLLSNARHLDLRLSEQRATREPLYAQLFAEHVQAEWFGEVLGELAGDRRGLETAQQVAYFERAIEGSELPEVRAQAMFLVGKLLMREGDAAQQAAGKRWLERAAKELADTRYGTLARAEVERPVVGQPAPDFSARTIDGATFKLSDYRGKVVLLDFYGFW